MALTKTSYSLLNGAPANVLDYGAVGDGTTDSTSAIQAALDAASATTFREVLLPAGNFIVSATLTIPEGVTLRGQGNRSAESLGVEGQPSSITKKATMTTAAIKMTGKRSRLADLGVYSKVGATGDGIWIAANYCSLVNVASNGHTGAGVRIGATAAGYLNCNAWYLEQVTASYNGSHGVIIDDQFTAYPLNDANAGTYIGGELRHNGDDGLFVGNCFGNTFIGILTEVNTGYGMFFDNESAKCTVLGGDQDEGNTVGVIYNNGQYHTFVGVLSSSFTDVGSFTNLLGFTGTKLNAATVATSVTVSTGSVTTAPSMVVLKNQSAEANGRGVAIEFQVPAGASTAPRAGGKLTVRNTIDPLYDSADLYLNVNGTLTGFVGWESYPTGRSYKPAVDNDVDLGYTSYRWKQLYAATATINTSDERQKEQFAEITTAERNAALKIKAIIKSFKFKDAVAQKGEDARIHFGVSAQAVAEIFRSEGLDPERYSLFCYDQWSEQEQVMEDGQVIVPYRAAGNAYGIRYEELLAFIIASL
jgi:hypothetical protein